MEKEERSIYRQISGKKLIAFAIIPFVVLMAMILFLFSPIGQSFLNSGVPVPEVTIEKRVSRRKDCGIYTKYWSSRYHYCTG